MRANAECTSLGRRRKCACCGGRSFGGREKGQRDLLLGSFSIFFLFIIIINNVWREEKKRNFLIRLSGLVRGPHTTLLPEGRGSGGGGGGDDRGGTLENSLTRTHTRTAYKRARSSNCGGGRAEPCCCCCCCYRYNCCLTVRPEKKTDKISSRNSYTVWTSLGTISRGHGAGARVKTNCTRIPGWIDGEAIKNGENATEKKLSVNFILITTPFWKRRRRRRQQRQRTTTHQTLTQSEHGSGDPTLPPIKSRASVRERRTHTHTYTPPRPALAIAQCRKRDSDVTLLRCNAHPRSTPPFTGYRVPAYVRAPLLFVCFNTYSSTRGGKKPFVPFVGPYGNKRNFRPAEVDIHIYCPWVHCVSSAGKKGTVGFVRTCIT